MESEASLQRTWILLAYGTAGALLTGFAALRGLWDPTYAARWLGLAALISAYPLAVLRQRLSLNYRPNEEELLPRLGPGTTATVLRGLMLAWVAGFALSPRPPDLLAWAPMLLFTIAEFLDYIDGYLARRSDQVTLLGESLDLEFDGLGMLVGSGLAVWYQVLPWPFLIIGAASYLFRFGLWMRVRRARPVRKLQPSTTRRPIAGLTMGYLSVILWPIVSPPATVYAGIFFLVPFLASFLRDWLVVSTTVDPDGPHYIAWRARARSILLEWTPIPMRVMVVLAFVQNSDVGGILIWIPVVMIALGIAGRAAAFALLFPVGLNITFGQFDAAGALALGSTLSILILGAGRFSLWKPEEHAFSRRAGE